MEGQTEGSWLALWRTNTLLACPAQRLPACCAKPLILAGLPTPAWPLADKYSSSSKLLRAYGRFLEVRGTAGLHAALSSGRGARCTPGHPAHAGRPTSPPPPSPISRPTQDVRSNPWAAMRYYNEADKLDLESREVSQHASSVGCGALGLGWGAGCRQCRQ